MCDPGREELERQLKKHDRLKDLEKFLEMWKLQEMDQDRLRRFFLVQATLLRRLLAPFDNSQTIPPGTIIPNLRKGKERRINHNTTCIDHRVSLRRILDRLSPK